MRRSASGEITPSPIDCRVTRSFSFSTPSAASTAFNVEMSVSVPTKRVGRPLSSHSTGPPRLRIQM